MSSRERSLSRITDNSLIASISFDENKLSKEKLSENKLSKDELSNELLNEKTSFA